MQSHLRSVFACLGMFVLFCLGGNEFGVEAQNSSILSKRPAVLRLFDRDKNETTILASFIDPESDAVQRMFTNSSDYPPPAIRLLRAEYTYPGTVPSRPQTIAFLLVPRDKYKTPPTFSITVAGTAVHEGEATLQESCCVTINGASANPQHIVISVPIEIFDRMTQTRKVELKLASKRGKYSFKLNDYQRKCLTALFNSMN